MVVLAMLNTQMMVSYDFLRFKVDSYHFGASQQFRYQRLSYRGLGVAENTLNDHYVSLLPKYMLATVNFSMIPVFIEQL